MTYYQIEALVDGEWTTHAIGNGNEFFTKWSAMEALTDLLEAHAGDAAGQPREYRVVSVHCAPRR